ncbi:hypothetical protein [Lacinutrix salivirga]
MKKIVLALFCIALVVGCKQEEAKKEVTPVQQKVKEPSKLVITIDSKTDTKDNIQCVFSKIELNTNNQKGAYVITESIMPNETFSVSKFEMFGDYVTGNVQLRLGNSPKKLTVNKMVFKYEDKEIIVNGNDVKRYFAANKYVKIENDSNIVETISIGGKHSPTLTLRQGFINRLFSLK